MNQVAILISLLLSASTPSELDVISTSIRSMLDRITSMEFEAHRTAPSVRPELQDNVALPPGYPDFKIRVWMDGNLFRMENGSSGKYLFDGQKYQEWSWTGILRTSRDLSSQTMYGVGATCPYTGIFEFLGPNMRNYRVIRLEDSWNAWRSSARIVRRDGETAVVESTVPGAGVTARVTFERKQGWMPTSMEVLEQPGLLLLVENYKSFDTEYGSVQIPLTRRLRRSAKEPLKLDFAVVADSVRLNKPIPHDIFTFPVSQAEYWQDLDKESGGLMRVGGTGPAVDFVDTTSQAELEAARHRGATRWAILATIGVLVVIAILLRLRAQRQKTVA